jgi:hypothetical protein
MSESARIQLVKARASVGSFLIEGARGPPGPPGLVEAVVVPIQLLFLIFGGEQLQQQYRKQ